MEILYSVGPLLAVCKPPGLAVHEAPGPGSSVLRVLRQEHGLTGLTPIHRLDKDASGVLLLARERSAASEIQRRWAEVEKLYLGLCFGVMETPEGQVVAPILENQTGKPERMAGAVRWFEKMHPGVVLPPLPAPKTSAVHPAGREAVTQYRVMCAYEVGGRRWSWLEFRPRQGRMHQLRVHLAHAGHPLAVDALYGSPEPLRERDLSRSNSERIILNRLALHAHSLRFRPLGMSPEFVLVEAPLPADLEEVHSLLTRCASTFPGCT